MSNLAGYCAMYVKAHALLNSFESSLSALKPPKSGCRDSNAKSCIQTSMYFCSLDALMGSSMSWGSGRTRRGADRSSNPWWGGHKSGLPKFSEWEVGPVKSPSRTCTLGMETEKCTKLSECKQDKMTHYRKTDDFPMPEGMRGGRRTLRLCLHSPETISGWCCMLPSQKAEVVIGRFSESSSDFWGKYFLKD